MKPAKESRILASLLVKLAPRIGARVVLEPVWRIVGQIIFKSGKHSYFRYNTLDLNPVGSSDIAKDKDYANFFMEQMGYPIVPKSKTFFSAAWARAIHAEDRGIDGAYAYAAEIGFPVVVKPNSGSQGAGVAFVATKRELYAALRRIFKKDRVALIQKPVKGKDYRLVVLDDSVISAYERIPLSVVGDGVSSIEILLAKKQEAFVREQRDTRIDFKDPRMSIKLSRAHRTWASVPQDGERVYLLDNANLSSGGDAIDVLPQVHPEFLACAVRLTRDMGLRLCGVDLIVDGDISNPPQSFWILEINAAPGLDHYARTGKKQQKIVEDLYLKVLTQLDT